MTKTGTEILGSPLFADRHASIKALRRLPKDVITRLHQLRRELPAASADELKQIVHAEFVIEPLVIGELRWIKIEASPRDFLNNYNCRMSGHLHEAEIPYTGNAVFLRLRGIDSFAFGFRGKIGPSSIRLRTFIDAEDYEWFGNDIEKALRAAREMLMMTRNSHHLLAEQAHELVERTMADILRT